MTDWKFPRPKTVPGDSRLAGLRVIIVEDEAMLALELTDMISELGCEVAGSATRLPSALDLAVNGFFDLAILDVNLNGVRVDEAADAIIARGKPVVFATGYNESGVAQHKSSWPIVNKPYSMADVEHAINAALDKVDGTGQARPAPGK